MWDVFTGASPPQPPQPPPPPPPTYLPSPPLPLHLHPPTHLPPPHPMPPTASPHPGLLHPPPVSGSSPVPHSSLTRADCLEHLSRPCRLRQRRSTSFSAPSGVISFLFGAICHSERSHRVAVALSSNTPYVTPPFPPPQHTLRDHAPPLTRSRYYRHPAPPRYNMTRTRTLTSVLPSSLVCFCPLLRDPIVRRGYFSFLPLSRPPPPPSCLCLLKRPVLVSYSWWSSSLSSSTQSAALTSTIASASTCSTASI